MAVWPTFRLISRTVRLPAFVLPTSRLTSRTVLLRWTFKVRLFLTRFAHVLVWGPLLRFVYWLVSAGGFSYVLGCSVAYSWSRVASKGSDHYVSSQMMMISLFNASPDLSANYTVNIHQSGITLSSPALYCVGLPPKNSPDPLMHGLS